MNYRPSQLVTWSDPTQGTCLDGSEVTVCIDHATSVAGATALARQIIMSIIKGGSKSEYKVAEDLADELCLDYFVVNHYATIHDQDVTNNPSANICS